MNKYLLMDGNNLAHIAFHRSKSIILKNKKEKDSEAKIEETDFIDVESMMYHVFFLKLHKQYKKFLNTYFIMCWDNPGSHEWRREIYPEYKSRRVYTEDPIWRVMFGAISKLQDVLNAYPMTQVTVEKLEADDILYSYSKFLKDYGQVTILSGDSDLIQAVQDFGVKLYHPIKDKYIKCPDNYDYCFAKAIQGDNTDDIPGVYGYGPVKSTSLAEAYAIDKNSINKLSEEQQKIVFRNMHLIQIKNNPNLNKAIPDINKIHSSTNVSIQKIKKFYFDNKLKTMLENLDTVTELFT